MHNLTIAGPCPRFGVGQVSTEPEPLDGKIWKPSPGALGPPLRICTDQSSKEQRTAFIQHSTVANFISTANTNTSLKGRKSLQQNFVPMFPSIRI